MFRWVILYIAILCSLTRSSGNLFFNALEAIWVEDSRSSFWIDYTLNVKNEVPAPFLLLLYLSQFPDLFMNWVKNSWTYRMCIVSAWINNATFYNQNRFTLSFFPPYLISSLVSLTYSLLIYIMGALLWYLQNHVETQLPHQ